MTVAVYVPEDYLFAGDNTTIVFPYGWKIWDASELEVLYIDDEAVETPLSEGIDYTVSGVSNPAGGNVTLIGYYATNPPLTGTYVAVRKKLPFTQGINFVEHDDFSPEDMMEAADRAITLSQQLNELLKRAPLVSIVSGLTDLILPVEALKFIRGNALGDGLEAVAGVPPASVWFSGAGVPADSLGVDGDYYLRTDNGYIYHKAAGSWGAGIALTLLINPMTAVADLIVGGADGVPARLAKGSIFQIPRMNEEATAIEWGPPFPNRNAIINGCGMINQRVTPYTLIKNEYCWDNSSLYGPDRFEGMAVGIVVSAGTFGNTAAANCGVSGYTFKFAGVTLTGEGPGIALYFRYRMAANDAARFKNQTASFRCQVYHNMGAAINYTIFIRKPNAADNFAAVTDISNSGAIAVPNATPTSLSYQAIAMGDCSNGIEIEIMVACGVCTNKNFEFTECQFELGPVATVFEFRPYGHELILCERYCEVHSSTVANVPYAMVACINATTAQGFFTYRQKKRAVPTVVFSATPGDFVIRSQAGNNVLTALSSSGLGVDSFLILCTVAGGLGVGDSGMFRAYSTNPTFILVDAEL